MRDDGVLEAFRGEAERLGRVLTGLPEPEWDRPTPCVPWRVRDLVGHVLLTVDRLPDMLRQPAPERAEVPAAGYYRKDARFAASANATRVAEAQEHATAHGSGPRLAREFTATWQRIHRLCLAEPEDRVVRTRHGDAMLLSEFLLTRVVELTVHGLDLASALDREPWLTSRAAAALEELLLGAAHAEQRAALGWDQVTFLRKATGREPITPMEKQRLDRLGLRWLALG